MKLHWLPVELECPIAFKHGHLMFFVLLAFVATQPFSLIFLAKPLSYGSTFVVGRSWGSLVLGCFPSCPPRAAVGPLVGLGVFGLVSGLGPFRAPGPWSLGRGSLVVGCLGAATTGVGVVAPNRICQ